MVKNCFVRKLTKGMVVCLMVLIFGRLVCYAAKVTLIYDPKGQSVNKVAIAGDFNSWNKDSDVFTKKYGIFKITLEMEEGLHYYKLVIDDNQWIEDPRAEKVLRKEDGYGSYNSGVLAGGDVAKELGPPAPDNINEKALKYEINVITGDSVEVKLRTLAGDAEKVFIVFGEKRMPLDKEKSFLGFDYYSDVIFMEKPGAVYFEITDGNAKIDYPENRVSVELQALPPPPAWANGCVWYQIMLDRFCNGENANDPKNTLPWGWDFSKPYTTEKGDFYSFVWDRFFGGDLQGLIKKLPYLKELGIEAIYLTPVFESKSYQKYDASDYRHIDDNYGFVTDYGALNETLDPKTWKLTETDKLFVEFLNQAHSMGMKVIIDGVFNHSGEDFWAFKDLKAKNEESQYKDWYTVIDWEAFKTGSSQGKGYSGWFGFGGLPEYREDEKGLVAPVKEHIFDITKRWMDPNGDGDPSDGIDGWRLDVPDCVKMPFWKDWVKHVRSINPNAYIAGELWVEAPQWLGKDLFDAQMNYPLAKLAVKYFIDKAHTPSAFGDKLNGLLGTYSMKNNLVQMNLLDSHDTDRIASMIANPGREYDKRNRLNPNDGGDYNKGYTNAKPSKNDYELLKQMTMFQFTFTGSPCIWYGDEAGMWGGDDPFDRKPMLWKEIKYDEPGAIVDEKMIEHYKKLADIRKKYPVLKTGVFKVLFTDDEKGIFAFERVKGESQAMVIINNSGTEQELPLVLSPGEKMTDAYENVEYVNKSNKELTKIVKIKPNWTKILVK